jgi:hypothetical protein
MRNDVDCSCFLEISTHLQETKLKIVVLLSRVERDKTLGEFVNSQLVGKDACCCDVAVATYDVADEMNEMQ